MTGHQLSFDQRTRVDRTPVQTLASQLSSSFDRRMRVDRTLASQLSSGLKPVFHVANLFAQLDWLATSTDVITIQSHSCFACWREKIAEWKTGFKSFDKLNCGKDTTSI